MENLEQWRYNTKGQRVETLIGMISLCEILNNGVIMKVSIEKGRDLLMRNFGQRAGVLAALGILGFGGFGTVAEAAQVPGPAIQEVRTVTGMKTAGIQRVSTISQVYGDGEKPAAVVLEYPAALPAALGGDPSAGGRRGLRCCRRSRAGRGSPTSG